MHRAQELDHLFRVWEALGNSVVLATFTCRHHRGMALRQLVEGQRGGWAAARSDRPYKADLAALQVAELDAHADERAELLAAIAAEPNAPGTQELVKRLRKLKKTRGVIRAFEATHGDENGWHPHFHVFFLVEGKITKEHAEFALAPMWDRWRAGLAEHGMTAVAEVNGESAGFDVQVLGEGSSQAWAKYPFKLALEAVGGVFKNGRDQDGKGRELGKRHRTPFEVMEHIAVAQSLPGADDAQAAADREILNEWSTTATDMRFRQCPWPPGMRAWFTQKAKELDIEGPLLEEFQEDDDVAAASVEGTETAGHISAGAWAGTVAYELDTLRAVGRRLGVGGVVSWHDRRGIAFELSRTGLAMLAEEQHHRPPGAIVGQSSGGRPMPRASSAPAFS
ncbi:hypothetical protein [Pseudonocardia sp. GCM10023141]|uniref:hypothetical protein n=1 Tax=Pseudonocardia sp. GCM10023141 TaxID=3252653 RepID=UPI0036091D62